MLESNADCFFPYTFSLCFLINKFLFRKITKHFCHAEKFDGEFFCDSKT